MLPARHRTVLSKLREVAGTLEFRPHRIDHLLDAKGRHELNLPSGFPFAISLFHLRAGAITERLTWHERLELLMPLDGPMIQRMGDQVVELGAGDLLVVDHLRPHQAVETPGLDTRLVVLSFQQECVFSPGSPPSDYAFLLPFFRKIEGRPQVLRAKSPRWEEAHEALRRLLECHFQRPTFHRDAGCKAWLLVLLNTLIHEFRDATLERVELLRRQAQVARLRPVFEHVRDHYAGRLSLETAARLCGVSKSVFGRLFREASGMTLGDYLNQVRMTHAVEFLEDGTDTIAEIASRLGFSDQSHFDRRFRRTFGRTPSQHRSGLSAGSRKTSPRP